MRPALQLLCNKRPCLQVYHLGREIGRKGTLARSGGGREGEGRGVPGPMREELD